MTRCCLLDGSAALRCDHNEGTAAVLGTLHALHQAPPLHASHVVGDSAALPLQEPGQIGNPIRPCGLSVRWTRTSKSGIDRPASSCSSLVQRGRQPRVQRQPSPPYAFLLRGQPPDIRAHAVAYYAGIVDMSPKFRLNIRDTSPIRRDPKDS